MVRLNTDLVYVTEVDDQAVVLDGTTSTYLTANSTGTLIIDELRNGSTIDSLVASVAERFEVDSGVARRDCVDFLRELESRGWLLDPEDPSAGSGA